MGWASRANPRTKWTDADWDRYNFRPFDIEAPVATVAKVGFWTRIWRKSG